MGVQVALAITTYQKTAKYVNANQPTMISAIGTHSGMGGDGR